MVDVMRMEVWLVRHGTTEFTAQGRFCGWSDPPLNETGRGQARALRPRLESLSFDSVVSSPSLRAVETARLAYGEPVTDDRLRELDFGTLDGQTWVDCAPDIREALSRYDTFEAPGGESVVTLGKRVIAALTDLGPGRHLVVTHGGVIRFVTGLASYFDYPQVTSVTKARLDFVDGVLSTVEVGVLDNR